MQGVAKDLVRGRASARQKIQVPFNAHIDGAGGGFGDNWTLAQSFDLLAEIASNADPLPVNPQQSAPPLQQIPHPQSSSNKIPNAFLPASSTAKRKQFYSFQEYHQDYVQKSTALKVRQSLSLKERKKLDEFSKLINKRLFECKQNEMTRQVQKNSPKYTDDIGEVNRTEVQKRLDSSKGSTINVIIDKDELLKQIKEQLKKKTSSPPFPSRQDSKRD